MIRPRSAELQPETMGRPEHAVGVGHVAHVVDFSWQETEPLREPEE